MIFLKYQAFEPVLFIIYAEIKRGTVAASQMQLLLQIIVTNKYH